MKFSNPGLFITFEGVDGSGKSTQIQLLRATLEKDGYAVFCTREPGGPPIAEQIRSLLLDPSNKEMAPITELLLYEASRSQHVQQWILPHLGEGWIILCDRFADASLAYQGMARGLGPELVKQLNHIATSGLEPDLTVVIDSPIQLSLNRSRQGSALLFPDGGGDRLEREANEFHETVRQAYRKLSAENERMYLVDGQQAIETIAKVIYERLSTVLLSKLALIKRKSMAGNK